MKVCLGQINTTPGDFKGNVDAMKKGIDTARDAACDLLIFPELSIPGYLSQDLIYHSEFLKQNLRALDELAGYTKGLGPRLHVLVGYIDENPALGKPFFNMAAVLVDGCIIARYKKQLLPFYDVFDELRYFEPGTDLLILEVMGQRVGVTICEDLWNDKGSDGYNHRDNPLQRYREQGVDMIVSLNSSPYVHDKPWQRLSVIAPSTTEALTLVYVNQRGGQDELIFDGQSFVLNNGDLIHLVSGIDADSYDVIDLDTAKTSISNITNPKNRDQVLSKSASLFGLLVLCLRDYVEKSGFSSIVVASSGGVDSALVCKIACEAIGAKNVHAVRMPSIYSSQHARDDAITLHENLGCWDYEVEISHTEVVAMLNSRYFNVPGDETNLVTQKMASGYGAVADENMQARMRDLYLMHFSNAFGAMPLSTGNKTESACGYYTHFDMNFSFAPIKDLYKFQVVELAQNAEEIPDNIWLKPPSAELAEGQTDEASLLPYAILDPIVQAYIEDYVSTFDELIAWGELKKINNEIISLDRVVFDKWLAGESGKADFNRIVSLIGRMEFKRRQTCPGVKVSKVAFGMGRRIPIVEKWS